MQADVEWIFPIPPNRDRYGSSFLQCPVNFKMFILFRDVFFDVPDRQSKGQKKTWFWFWYDHTGSGCPSLQRALSRKYHYFSNVTSQATWI